MRRPTGPRRVSRAACLALASLLLAGLVVLGCAAVHPLSPYADEARPWHTETGFRNNYADAPQHSLLELMRWRLFGSRADEPAGGWKIPVVEADARWLAANRSEATVTWIGHSTFLIQIGGQNILTDPQFSDRASPLSWIGPRRSLPPALGPGTLPHIDLVLISHNHYDHLDLPSLRILAAQAGGPPQMLVPLGLAGWLKREGIPEALELDWWSERALPGVRVVLVPAQHWSTRNRIDFDETLWGGFVIEAEGRRVFFAGDTGYSRDFADIRRRLGPMDLAMIPIGAYAPRSFMQANHVDPSEAVQIALDLEARHAVGMHWGTFRLTDEPLDEPPHRLAEAAARARLPPGRFFTMAIGETRLLADPEKPRPAGGAPVPAGAASSG
jgi:L-ascorbate metabolism protein UlaG (beta-lactamase superfamily)